MAERILSRRLAEEMAAGEVAQVSGAGCFYTPNTFCDTWEEGRYDSYVCDAGLDCDF